MWRVSISNARSRLQRPVAVFMALIIGVWGAAVPS
jgi:hypothetical protein